MNLVGCRAKCMSVVIQVATIINKSIKEVPYG
jgi:hypothetical protein